NASRTSSTASSAGSAIPPPAAPVLLDVAVASPRHPRAMAQVELADVLVRGQPLAIAVENDAAVLDDIAVVRELERDLCVLLDEEDGHAQLVADGAEAAGELLDDERRQPEGQLVDQQQLRRGHEP